MATSTETTTLADAGRRVFTRVIAGIDGSPEAREAARQASVLADGRDLTLLAAWNLQPPVIVPPGGFLGGYVTDEETARGDAELALAAAVDDVEDVAPARREVARGVAWQALTEECVRRGATLVAVGSHGHGRARGILTGSTATELMHKAPCSVLVARAASDEFPRRIVIGVDGSAESAAAYAAARHLADRFGSELWPVVAQAGKGIDKKRVARIVDRHHEQLPDEPVRALVVASADADLVVVGSRGLHGFRALGSVSERVGHGARCSVLIVR
jgi:nucleotide-binding universal stress UspA family protein